MKSHREVIEQLNMLGEVRMAMNLMAAIDGDDGEEDDADGICSVVGCVS